MPLFAVGGVCPHGRVCHSDHVCPCPCPPRGMTGTVASGEGSSDVSFRRTCAHASLDVDLRPGGPNAGALEGLRGLLRDVKAALAGTATPLFTDLGDSGGAGPGKLHHVSVSRTVEVGDEGARQLVRDVRDAVRAREGRNPQAPGCAARRAREDGGGWTLSCGLAPRLRALCNADRSRTFVVAVLVEEEGEGSQDSGGHGDMGRGGAVVRRLERAVSDAWALNGHPRYEGYVDADEWGDGPSGTARGERESEAAEPHGPREGVLHVTLAWTPGDRRPELGRAVRKTGEAPAQVIPVGVVAAVAVRAGPDSAHGVITPEWS